MHLNERQRDLFIVDNDDSSTNNLKRGILKRSFKTSATPPRKEVSFQSFVKAYKILHIKEYSIRQIRNTWYSEDEYKRIKKNMYSCLSSKETSTLLKEEDRFICTRGLEDMSLEGQASRQQRREQARDAVLNAQLLGMKDDEILAHAYAVASIESKRIARLRGIADEQAVHYTFQDESHVARVKGLPVFTPSPTLVAPFAA
ncbi:hypothetical protein IV203_032378 [Nitzschia inconspicua]|uniref:Uncharacterized protein n=1 Tax=Nitzschia inconspicua TaxID=303405 RepID=A0A9K3K4F3_9STRA|nr:hypothetical protein IV203_020496 [Nitzschia inconspicua]KAG7344847.1 hypothetical protein IV203_032378 [Nitzschia inconspicua]